MPLKLQVGLQQKVGLPDYGSLGAACHVELELDGLLLERSPDTFQQEVARAFAACRQAVTAELHRQQPQATESSATFPPARRSRTTSARRATASQIRAIKAIATRQGWNLETDLRQRFGFDRPEELDLQQASRWIDELNRAPQGSRV